MMAFFLLLWLLSSVSQGALNGIAEYFRTPLKIALMGGSRSGDTTSPIKGGGQDPHPPMANCASRTKSLMKRAARKKKS